MTRITDNLSGKDKEVSNECIFLCFLVVCVNTEQFAQLSHAQINAERHDPSLSAANTHTHDDGVRTQIWSDATNPFQIYSLYTNNSTNITSAYDIIFQLITRRGIFHNTGIRN